MKQSALTILAPSSTRSEQPETKKERVKAIGRVLNARLEGGAVAGGAVSEEVDCLIEGNTIHYMSVFYVNGVNGKDAHVALEIHADESATQMRRRLARDAQQFLGELFFGCKEFPTNPNEHELERFLRKHTRRPLVYFVAFPGKTVRQIGVEQELRRSARTAFESAPPKLDVQKLAKTAPLQAPSSASAMWEYLRTNDEVKPALRGPGRPLSVRWNLEYGGFLERANLWTGRFWWVLVVLSALLWVSMAPPIQSIGLMATAFALVALGVLVLWWRLAPRTLSFAGGLRVLGSALEAWALRGAIGAALAASCAVVVQAVVYIAHSWPASATSMTCALAAWITVTLALRRLGFAATIPASLVLVVSAICDVNHLDCNAESAFCDVCHRVPQLDIPWLVFWAFIALTSVPAILANLAAIYVLDGAIIGWTTTLLTTIATGFWVHLMVSARGSAWPLAWATTKGLAVLAALLIISAVRIVFWLQAVRRAEERENLKKQPALPDITHLEEVEDREDRTLQNHLVTVSAVKESPIRILTLRRVLRALSLLVKVYFNQADLGGIRTIHFAQFLILENPDRLLFMSNYDAAFGSYLQEFNSVRGVTAVWSNCDGFPPSFGLLRDGAEDEQRFRQFGRRNQAPTLGWFSAYPDLFIRDIATATATRENLQRRLEDPSTLAGQLRAIFGEPLSEADCDASLQKL
jgi:hypothetical protein